LRAFKKGTLESKSKMLREFLFQQARHFFKILVNQIDIIPAIFDRFVIV
jgi:hypothetical protein